MMKRCIHETRLAYLLRVAISHLREHAAEGVTEYDGTECDGYCLADDLQTELDSLPSSPSAEAPAVRDDIGDRWPTPWINADSDGSFGTILASNGEPVAQVMPLSPRFEPDIMKRNKWRNRIARHIAEAVNEKAAFEFIGSMMPEDRDRPVSCKAPRSDIVNKIPGLPFRHFYK